jgi:hypothetical protein
MDDNELQKVLDLREKNVPFEFISNALGKHVRACKEAIIKNIAISEKSQTEH